MSERGLEAYLEVEERQQQTIQWTAVGLIAREIWKFKGLLFSGVAALLIGTLATLLEPRLFGIAIDEAIVPRDLTRLTQIGVLFLIAIVFRVAATILQGILFERLGQSVTQELRLKVFSHLQRLPAAFFDRNPAGKLLTRVTNDVESVSEMFSAGFVSMIGNFSLVVGILICIFALDWRLALYGMAPFPLLIAASVYFSKRLRISYREARSKLSALNAFIAENILGMKVVQLFNRQKTHLNRFDRINQWYADAQIGTVKVYALFQPSITLTAAISLGIIIYLGGQSVAESKIPVGTLVALFSYALAAFQPMRELADKWNLFLSGMASAERIFSILAPRVAQPELSPRDLAMTPEKITLRGEIEFQNVWFAYDVDSRGEAAKEHWVLKDLSLKISPGQRIGIVGHTGSGKTTLISLLMRFYEPQKGRILIDGKDIREYDRRALRQAIGIIQQDVFLFSGSLADNITFWDGQPQQTLVREIVLRSGGKWEEQVGAAAKNELNERGQNFSMGQRQMLAFARAIEQRPSLWILDEATANMDSGSEQFLQESLESASRGATTLLIAHRLATVRQADRILVMNKGVLREQGKHTELMALDGLYARLYRFQEMQETKEKYEQSGLERR